MNKMNKFKKSEIKDIVKECLIEILLEGIDISKNEKLSIKKEEDTQFKKGFIEENKRVNNTTRQLIKNTTSDPIIADILADTARTTLQEQLNADNSKNISSIRQTQNNDISMFDSSNWATLAFNNKSR